MSGLFGSTTIKGTRLTDFSATSAEVGKAIPFGYGTFPVDGFIGWAPLPPVEHRKVKRQGKGGVKQETYTYTLSYAVFFCKGPIYGVKWIKRNGKVVYTTDPNAPIEDRQYAAKWAQRVNFHWGTRDQLPDSLIESYEGVGNVSGFPDMFYITVEDEDVTDNGGAPPNYEACVVASAPDVYLTSRPYPNDMAVEAVSSLGSDIPYGQLKKLIIEEGPDSVEISTSVLGGEMRDVYHEYALVEGADVSASVVGGSLKPARQDYNSGTEAIDVSASVQSGSMKTVLRYTDMLPEAVSIQPASVVSGSLAP